MNVPVFLTVTDNSARKMVVNLNHIVLITEDKEARTLTLHMIAGPEVVIGGATIDQMQVAIKNALTPPMSIPRGEYAPVNGG